MRRFVPEARAAGCAEPAVIWSRHAEHAQQLAQEFQIPTVAETPEELLRDVNAVYVAVPHPNHEEFMEKALLAGKHVLCEKPMSFSRAKLERLYGLAGERHLVLLEGIKTAYCPGFRKVLQLVQDGTIGKVIDVEAAFTRIPDSNVREVWDTAFGGSFTEYGTYALLPALMIPGTGYRSVTFETVRAKTGVDAYTKASLHYEGAMAAARTGLGVKSEGQLVISGTRGYILVPSPWWLTRHIEVHYEDPGRTAVYDLPYEGSGLRYEIAAFCARIRENEAEPVTPDRNAEPDAGFEAGQGAQEAGPREEAGLNAGSAIKKGTRLVGPRAAKTDTDAMQDISLALADIMEQWLNWRSPGELS